MINLYLDQNLKKIKFLFFFLLLISTFLQLFLLSNYENIYSILWLLLSNLIIYFYCFYKKNILEFPLSTFSLIFVNFYSNSGAIFFKSFLLDSIDKNLYSPNFTFAYLFLFNFLLIIFHFIYKNLFFLNILKKNLRKVFFLIKLDKYNSKEYLYFIGYITIFFGAFSITYLNEFIWRTSSLGPNLLGDLLNGLKILNISPFIVLYTFKIYEYDLKKEDYLKLLIFFLAALYLSLGLNSRSVFFDIFFTGLLIYCYFVFTGIIEIKVLRFNKIFFVLLISILLSNYIDRFSNSYLQVRDYRNNINPIQNIKNHFNFFNVKKNDYLKTRNAEISSQIFREDYYEINFLNRINVVKATDNIIYAKKYLTSDQIEKIIDYEFNKIISILPGPLIAIFNPQFNKTLYFNTITSTIYKEVDRLYVGGKSNGIVFGILYLYEDFWMFLLFIFALLISFTLIDSFFISNKSYFIIIFILLYLTSGGLINVISSGSVADMLGVLIRGIPQSIILYVLICKFYQKILNFK